MKIVKILIIAFSIISCSRSGTHFRIDINPGLQPIKVSSILLIEKPYKTKLSFINELKEKHNLTVENKNLIALIKKYNPPEELEIQEVDKPSFIIYKKGLKPVYVHLQSTLHAELSSLLFSLDTMELSK
ncbi:hypothetical protein [Ekhidna sp.]